jgi:hypothetical protein
MPGPVRFLALALVAVLLYLALFGLLVDRPLTIGIIGQMAEQKRAYALSVGSPKLVLLAGSNARMSHRCEAITPLLGMPCVNAGISRGIGLDYLFDVFAPTLQAGDVVYMPLEYTQYLDDRAAAMSGPDAGMMFRHDKRRLLGLGPERTVRAAFSFDVPYLIAAAVEMSLQAAGVRRRYSLETLNQQGDETGHTLEKAQAYRGTVTAARTPIPPVAAYARGAYAQHQLRAFLADCLRRGIRVVGGLQTTVDDEVLPLEVIAWLRQFYERAGHAFLVLPGHSLYPLSCFYDTAAHLAEPCQIAHSRLLAAGLKPLLASP